MSTDQPSTPNLRAVRRSAASPGAIDCHALRLRLPGPIDVDLMRDRLRDAAGPVRLWTDPVPGGPYEPVAVGRREVEMARPVGSDPGLRAVVLGYSEGSADLVLVARRDRLDYPALSGLARALFSGNLPTRRSPARGLGLGRTAITNAAPAWGLGDPSAGAAWERSWLPIAAVEDPADWASALLAVVARYDPDATVTVGQRRTGPSVLRPEPETLDGLRARVREWLARSVDTTDIPRPTVGLILDAATDELLGAAGDDAEYRPYLAPPFPLTLTLLPAAAGHAELHWQHPLRAFSPAAARQFVDSVVHVHGQLVAHPTRPLTEVEILSPEQRERIDALGDAVRPLATTPSRLPEVFGRQVALLPDAVAVSDESGAFTYAELDQWSNRLAHGLRALNVGDGDLVGVGLERTAELIAVLLAVLKAGAAYVPLDVTYPADRLTFTIEDSGAAVVVTRRPFPESDGVRFIDPSAVDELGADRSGLPPVANGRPTDTAYVIYTSGSTGRPKGVLVPHANVISLLDATRDDFGLNGDDVWTFFHSAAFDFSVWEIWGCLLTGGHLVVVPYGVSRSPEQFHRLLVDRRVTVLSQTPSAFAQLQEVGIAPDSRLGLRLVVFGGEPLDARGLLPWFDRYPASRCRLVNMFGITETTVHVTASDVTRESALAASRSVGRPLPGWSVRIRDEAGLPVPIGVPGEIHVGGAGVAAGYLNRPGLTAERFLTDTVTGVRTYRSGDRGRLLPDGVLEHLGRIDDQVKVRGFRIELNEIRVVLSECPGVAAAAVALHHGRPGDPATARIDAYVVPASGATPRVAEHAARMLPEHMRPATITVMAALPTTANGKVDRSRLPRPDRSATPTADHVSAPANDSLMSIVAEVWQEIFGCAVSTSDDFFELGGNSLLAVRMAASMRRRGLPTLLPRTLYLHPTVATLANALRDS